MAVSVTCASVTFVPETGRLYMTFATGSQIEAGPGPNKTRAEAAAIMLTERAADLETSDVASKFLVAWWLSRSPDGTNENLVEGKTLTMDISGPNPIRVQ